MKPVSVILVLAGFVAVAVFGFLGMNHAQNIGHDDCIASAALGACHNLGRTDLVFLHISAFQRFSEAVIGGAAGTGWLLALFAAVFIAGAFLLFSPERSWYLGRQFESDFLGFRKEFLHWLALHENSPSFAMGAGV